MIFGCILILLGVLPAAANWYSPFSHALKGKHSSMVPPVGGLLIGLGLYVVTGSIWWSTLAIPADLGLVLLPCFVCLMLQHTIAYSARNEIANLEAFRDGHKTTLKLYRNFSVRIEHSTGDTKYGMFGNWRENATGYELTDYIKNRVCRLVQVVNHFNSFETIEQDDSRNEMDLNGLAFASSKKT